MAWPTDAVDNVFNAGYTSTLSRDESGKLSVGDRHIRELSVVQKVSPLSLSYL